MSRLESAVEVLLEEIGEDTRREGLKDTPRRVAKMYLELTSGLREPPPQVTTFSRGKNDQMITVLGIEYSSLCEHHLVSFTGKVHVGYIPGDKIAGLSKFARVIEWFAKRPQIQEQFTAQVADHLFETLSPQGLIVVVEGHHLCMAIRGVKKPGHTTVTSAIRGTIPKDEFFDLLKMHRGK